MMQMRKEKRFAVRFLCKDVYGDRVQVLYRLAQAGGAIEDALHLLFLLGYLFRKSYRLCCG